MDWREASDYRPKGHAALGRSTSFKPPALPEVADSVSLKPLASGNLRSLLENSLLKLVVQKMSLKTNQLKT
jgi:hypothetical protein